MRKFGWGCGGTIAEFAAQPAAEFAHAVAIAREAELRFTRHAGKTSTAVNVWEMARMGADRIGHGIRAVEDSSLLAILRERGIALEVCPISNLRTATVSSFALAGEFGAAK